WNEAHHGNTYAHARPCATLCPAPWPEDLEGHGAGHGAEDPDRRVRSLGSRIRKDAWGARPCGRGKNSPAYANLPLDGNGEYHITAGNNETWNSFRNIQGKMMVDAGATLTIDGTTIAFAPSTPQLTTNITVMPGGTLVV